MSGACYENHEGFMLCVV